MGSFASIRMTAARCFEAAYLEIIGRNMRKALFVSV